MDLEDGSPIPGLALLPGNPNAQLNVQLGEKPGVQSSEQPQDNQGSTPTLDGAADSPFTTEQQDFAMSTAAEDYEMSQTPEPALQASGRSETPTTTESNSAAATPGDTDAEHIVIPRRCLRCKSVKKGCSGGKPCDLCVRANLSEEDCETDVEYETCQRRKLAADKNKKPKKATKGQRQSSVGASVASKRSKSPKKKSGRAKEGEVADAAAPADDEPASTAQTTTATHHTNARAERSMSTDFQPFSTAVSASSSPHSSPSPGAHASLNGLLPIELTKPADDAMSLSERNSSEVLQQLSDVAAAQATDQGTVPVPRATSATGYDNNNNNVGVPLPGTGPRANPALPLLPRQPTMDLVTSLPVTPSQNDMLSSDSTAPKSGSAAPAKTPRKRNTTKSPAPRVPKEKKTPVPKKSKDETGDESDKKTKTPRKRAAKKVEPKGSGPNHATPVQGSSLRNEVFPDPGANKDGGNAPSSEQRPGAAQFFGGVGHNPSSIIPSQEAMDAFPRNSYLDNIRLNPFNGPDSANLPSLSGFAPQQQQQGASSFPTNPYTATVEMDTGTTAPGPYGYDMPSHGPRQSSERDNANLRSAELREQSAHITPPPGASNRFNSYFDVGTEPSSNGDETPSRFSTSRRSNDVPVAFMDAVRDYQRASMQIPPSPFSGHDTPSAGGTANNSDADRSSHEVETGAASQTASEQQHQQQEESSPSGADHQNSHKRPRSLSTSTSTIAKRPRISEPAVPAATSTNAPGAQPAHGDEGFNNEGSSVNSENGGVNSEDGGVDSGSNSGFHNENNSGSNDASANENANASNADDADAPIPFPTPYLYGGPQSPRAHLLGQIVAMGDRIKRSDPTFTTTQPSIDKNKPAAQPSTAPRPFLPPPPPPPQFPTPLTPQELRAITAYPPGVSAATYARLTRSEAVSAELERYLVWFEGTFGGDPPPYDVPPPGHNWARLRLDLAMPAVWRVGMRPRLDGEWPVGGRIE